MFRRVLAVVMMSLFLMLTETLPAAPNTAYVTNSADNTVSEIDTTADAVIPPPIAVGNVPARLAFTPDGSRVYVLNINAMSVSVIDTATNMVIATILGFTNPSGIAITPDGLEAYVSNRNINTVSIIDTDPSSGTYNTIINTVSDISFNAPVGIGMTPDGTKVFVPNQSGNSVSVITTATNMVTTVLDMGTFMNPSNVVVAPNGLTAYVTNLSDVTVSVIDITMNAVTGTIMVGLGPKNLAVSPDGTKVYGTFGLGAFVINTSNNVVTTISDPMSTFNGTLGVAITVDGTKAYVANSGANTLSIIDVATDTVTGTITVGNAPRFIAVSPCNTSSDCPICKTCMGGVCLNSPSGAMCTLLGCNSASCQNGICNCMSVGPLPPASFSGVVIVNEFLTQIDRIHKLFWTASPDPTVVSYHIYRGSVLIGSVPASGPLIFLDHNQNKKVAVIYTIRSVNSSGVESTPLSVTLQ